MMILLRMTQHKIYRNKKYRTCSKKPFLSQRLTKKRVNQQMRVNQGIKTSLKILNTGRRIQRQLQKRETEIKMMIYQSVYQRVANVQVASKDIYVFGADLVRLHTYLRVPISADGVPPAIQSWYESMTEPSFPLYDEKNDYDRSGRDNRNQYENNKVRY